MQSHIITQANNPLIHTQLYQLTEQLKLRNYAYRTIDSYTTCVKYFLIRLQKRHPEKSLQHLTQQEIIDFVLTLQSAGKAPKTINLYKEAIKFYCYNILHLQIAIHIKLSKEPKKLPIVLSKSELESMFSVTTNPKHKLILMLSYGSGLRISETRNLRIRDIDLAQLTIHIKASKGNKDRITILSPKLLPLLQQNILGKQPTDFLFTSERGGPLHVRTLSNIFSHALEKAGILKPATFHSLRHSFATHLIENGTDIRYIQSLLGHTNIRTTQTYTHVTNPAVKHIVSPL